MIICTAGIIVAFNYHEIFETDAVKVTSNTNNTQNDTSDGINSTFTKSHSTATNTSNDGKRDPTVSERTAAHKTHQYSQDFVPGSTFSHDDSENGKTRYVYDSTRIDADGDGRQKHMG